MSSINCAADRTFCPVTVLCCRCAYLCINVRVVIYGISSQCGRYRGNTGRPVRPSVSHNDHLSEEEDSATPPFHQQEELVGEIQVTNKALKKNTNFHCPFNMYNVRNQMRFSY